jgi:endonuclease/exonuclease/phosphatase family metal-dependent hydrolase
LKTDRAALRIATYNVHRCIGRDGRTDVARCLRVIEELSAEVIGLQEVDANHRGEQSGEALLEGAEALGYAVVHGMTLRRPDADYGNALLYRGDLLELHRHDLSVPGVEPRGLIEARVSAGGEHWRVCVTHLGLRGRERAEQAGLVADVLDTDDTPTVLLGDFNEWRPFARSLRALERRFGPTPAPRSFPARWPLRALDRIWVRPAHRLRGLRVHRSVTARVTSDHLPLIADLSHG